MKTAFNILITVVVAGLASVGAFYWAYNYLPQNILTIQQQPKSGVYGATITTIQGTDTLSGSRTTINTNFANLNASKAEISDVSGTTTLSNLANVGTIVTGIWNASTLTVPYGGTGSTTLSQYQVLLGAGASNIGVVPGFGTSGQFLTSNGAATPPTWQSSSINLAANYAWTGLHSFAATTTLATTTINGSQALSTSTGAVFDYQVFTTSGTWTKPSLAIANNMVVVMAWGAGGGGGASTATNKVGPGGGGGACVIKYLTVGSLTSTVTVTVGAGGIGDSQSGGNTTFGTYLTAYGGGAGESNTTAGSGSGGGGGGVLGVGNNGVGGQGAGGNGGNPNSTFGIGGTNSGTSGGDSASGGGGGGGDNSSGTNGAGGNSEYGGGGGGGASSNAGAAGGSSYCGGGGGAGGANSSPGVSVLGGGGGTSDTNGTQPGGGAGGAHSNNTGKTGGAGEVIVWVL